MALANDIHDLLEVVGETFGRNALGKALCLLKGRGFFVTEIFE